MRDKSKLSLVFQKQRGCPRGKAITNYLMIATNQATYGVELFRGVHDKNKHEWVVGVCYNGIHRYHVTSLDQPDKIYDWKKLDNLYFKVNLTFLTVFSPDFALYQNKILQFVVQIRVSKNWRRGG